MKCTPDVYSIGSDMRADTDAAVCSRALNQPMLHVNTWQAHDMILTSYC